MYNLTNIDFETGIRYSTIYGNDVSPFFLDDIITDCTDLTYEEALRELNSYIRDNLKDLLNDQYINPENSWIKSAIDNLMDAVQEQFNDQYMMNCESSTYLYERDGYKITYHTSDNSLTILKSPYYTYSHLASPCFPNGCYLPDYDPDYGHKCYCLDPSFFDSDIPAPYTKMYSVETNEEVRD